MSKKVIVLGAGITGVTTAWFLRQAGFEVSVVDRQESPAQETSFANGGQVSVSHPEPWANPSAPWVALRWLGRADAPLKWQPRFDWAQWQWIARFLRECLPWRTRRNTAAIAALAVHSLSELRRLRQAAGIAEEAYDARARGILHLFFERASFRQAQTRVGELAHFGIELRSLTAEQCAQTEPALAACVSRLAGGLYAPHDESGDAMRFSQALAEALAANGVRFHYGAHIERLCASGGRIGGIDIRRANAVETLSADAFVVCLASDGRRLLRPIGENVPIFPLKGYSMTAPIRDAACAPQMSLTDESRRIVCSRLGNRLRVAGTAELNDDSLTIDPARIAAMQEWVELRLPGAIDPGNVTPWAGLRPMMPGGVPVIGRGHHANLWFNTGHGTLGWTLSCGSASVLAALMRGERPVVQFPVWGG
ncbi:MAG: D-amino acid dehydrogenase [Azoarcus sp.]|jgi:D-amino-acid dehydrogenase|nr:D-amino acid dehydrogenase [Azoarcus sp.]